MHESSRQDEAVPPREVSPDASDYGPGGVDRTLLRWMQSLTPGERLQALQETVDSIEGLRLARKTGD